jgi:hypothetical protein
MLTHRADSPQRPTGPHEPFRLESLPAEVWGMKRMQTEFRATDWTIRWWVRSGKLPKPCLRRDGRPYWDAAKVEFYRKQRLHRLGAEM